MKTSAYFNQILFCTQSPAVDHIFEEKSSKLFESIHNKPFIEIHSQPLLSIDPDLQGGPWIHVDKPDPSYDSNCRSPPEPSCQADRSHYSKQKPPQGVAEPGLHLRKILNSHELNEVATVSFTVFRLG